MNHQLPANPLFPHSYLFLWGILIHVPELKYGGLMEVTFTLWILLVSLSIIRGSSVLPHPTAASK